MIFDCQHKRRITAGAFAGAGNVFERIEQRRQPVIAARVDLMVLLG
jgi:hypothetical protein